MNVRRPTPADAAAVAAVAAAYDRAQWGDSDVDEAEIRDWWAELDLGRDAWLVELDGRPAGYGQVERDEEGIVFGDGYVHPEAVGYGVGARLVDLTEQRGRELGATTIRNGTLASDERARALLEGRGYAATRHFLRMGIDLGSEEPAAPAAVDGIPIGRFDPEREAEAVHAAIEEAFAGEWAYRSRPFDEWRTLRLEGERFDPGLWPVARDGEEIAAVSVGERHAGGGWISYVSVRPPWRRRGLGEALLRNQFLEFHRRGERRVALGVDTENPTGASRLYERAGMRVLFRIVFYEKALG